MEANNYSVSALAYLGDSVIEVMTREKLVKSGISDAGKLNAQALEYVKAASQSAAMDKLESFLSEEELYWFKRGRNQGHNATPKSATVREYRRATGMEVLFAALYLENQNERLRELFDIAFG